MNTSPLSAHTDECDELESCRVAACDCCDREVPACHITRRDVAGLGETFACHACCNGECEVCEAKA